MEAQKNNVIVTGGAGFIGSHLVDRMVDMGCHVTVVDNLSFGARENVNNESCFVCLDIRDYLGLRELISDIKPRVIFHLAANATTKETSMGWLNPTEDYEINALGTLNVLRAITELGVDTHVVYTSSAAVYGEPDYTPIDERHPTNPISPYGISKLAGEKYCWAFFRENNIKTTVIRLFNTYGPRQPRYVMFDLIKKLKDNPNDLDVLGTGQQIRDYCYVSETVDALVLAAEGSAWGKVYNVAGQNPIPISDVVNLIIKLLGLECVTRIHYMGKSWKGDISVLAADISRIKTDLGFIPRTTLVDGLKQLVKWFEHNEDVIC